MLIELNTVKCDRIIVIITEQDYRDYYGNGRKRKDFVSCTVFIDSSPHQVGMNRTRPAPKGRARPKGGFVPALLVFLSRVHGFEINLCIMIASIYVNLYCRTNAGTDKGGVIIEKTDY
jgi:hypothetical protein